MIASFFADPGNTKDLVEARGNDACTLTVRHVVGSCPWGSVFYVIIAGHVLRKHSDLVVGVLRQQVGSCQA